MKQKYLFFYINAGGGHLSSARSVAESMVRSYGDTIETILVDGLAKSPNWLKYIIVDGYKLAQTKLKGFFMFLYALHKINLFGRSSVNFTSGLIKEDLRQVILLHKPHKIVIFHFFMSKPVYEILKEENLNIPIVTVVTDPYTAPKMWFLNEQQNFVVFSEELANYITTQNLPQKKVHVFPYIINEKYKTPLPIEKIDLIKSELGFTSGKPLILIIGGGDGIPKARKIIKNLFKSDLDAEFAIVCGKSKKMFNTAIRLKGYFPAKNIAVYGFINFVYELMNISDVVVTKGGPATIMEILMLGKIPVINNYIWEQEKGNVEFVINNKVGFYERKTRRLSQVIQPIFRNPESVATIKRNIQNLKLENGTQKLTTFLKEFEETTLI